jgi:hypothetical protein
MPFTFAGDTITADRDSTVEDALPLLEFLQSHGDAEIDLGACTHMHTAVLQVLLAARPRIVAPTRESFLARWLPFTSTSVDGGAA